MRIGVVGAGASGLTIARLLHPQFDVRVFENEHRIGGNVETVSVAERGDSIPVDVRALMFLPRMFRQFTRLLGRLRVPYRPTRNTVSIRFPDTRTDFDYHRRSFFRVGDYRHARIRGLAWSWVEFVRAARRARSARAAGETTLHDFVREHRIEPDFVNTVLLPLVMSGWTLDSQDALGFPARTITDFLASLNPLNPLLSRTWQTIPGGMGRYIAALAAPLEGRIRLGAGVEFVERGRTGVWVKCRDREPEAFDQVVLAVPADHALRVLRDPHQVERQTLAELCSSAVHTQVLHSDVDAMRALDPNPSAWNMHLRRGPGEYGVEVVAAWCQMNLLCNAGGGPYFVSRVVGSGDTQFRRTHQTYRVETPRFTSTTRGAQARFAEVSGVDRIHYCGACWSDAVHEGAITSALRVARAFGRSLDDL